MDKVQLTIDGHPAGECDADTFELVKLYLADGKKALEIGRELMASGIARTRATVIVVNAKFELGR